MSQVLIRAMQSADLRRVAELHRLSYERDHFTSRFTIPMLADLYQVLSRGTDFAYVAELPGSGVVGVAVAGYGIRRSIMRFVRSHLPQLAFIAVRNPRFLPSKAVGLLRLLRAALLPAVDTPSAPGSTAAAAGLDLSFRYITLLVSPEHRKLGIAKKLTAHLETQMVKAGIAAWGGSVKKSNRAIIKFHLGNGCEIERETADSIYFFKRVRPAPRTDPRD